MTEWVVSRHGDVKGIQEAFRSGSLDGDDMEQKQWSSGDKFIGALEKAKQSIVVMHDSLHQESLILQQSIATGKYYFVMSSKGGQRSQSMIPHTWKQNLYTSPLLLRERSYRNSIYFG